MPTESLYPESKDGEDRYAQPLDIDMDERAPALLCEQRSEQRMVMSAALGKLDFKTTVAVSAEEGLKQIHYRTFKLVVLDETFDCLRPENNHILKYFREMAMSLRRNTYLVLIADRFRTRDTLAAFSQSVDLIINPKHIPLMEKILLRGLKEHASFYHVFNTTLKNAGKF